MRHIQNQFPLRRNLSEVRAFTYARGTNAQVINSLLQASLLVGNAVP